MELLVTASRVENLFFATGVVQDDFVNSCNVKKCGSGEGKCFKDSECESGLLCGSDNCKQFHPLAEENSNCCVPGHFSYVMLSRESSFGCMVTHKIVELVTTQVPHW